jgi:hypothetical protein
MKLHLAVCKAQGWKPAEMRFYTGVPDKDRDPQWSKFWSAKLARIKKDGGSVTTRPLHYRKELVLDAYGEPIVEGDGSYRITDAAREKGIDVRLALDVASHARRKMFDVAIIFSQDKDLAEIAADVRLIAREHGRWMQTVCAFPANSKSTDAQGLRYVDWFVMTQTFYNRCLDSTDYRSKES